MGLFSGVTFPNGVVDAAVDHHCAIDLNSEIGVKGMRESDERN